MKRLILLLLLAACSHEHDHEHPLISHAHQHEHDVPQHDHLSPLGLPFPYITRVYPPLEVPGFPPFGFLKSPYVVYIFFSASPETLSLTNIEFPFEDTTQVRWGYVIGGEHFNRVRVRADCSDQEHTGAVAFRLDWNGGSANFYYKCPD